MAVANVIKFDGFSDRKWLVFKHPSKDILDKSKVIVGPGQVAIMVHGGKVVEIFESGTVELSTLNYPVLKTFIEGAYDGKTPFPVEIYFVNRILKLDMLWGTKEPIAVLDPKFQVRVNVRARGQYALRISNYQFILTTLVGSLGGKNIVEFEVVNDFFRAIINTKVKTNLADKIIRENVSTLDIALHMETISKETFTELESEFERFGFELVNFYFESISVPKEDLERVNEILNKKAEFNILGDDRYRTSRGFDVLEKAADNESQAGGIASMGLGLGVGVGVGTNVGKIASDSLSNTNPSHTPSIKNKPCISCHKLIEEDDVFCPECGTKQELKCSKCNQNLKPTDRFCPSCGQKAGE
ncbi:Antifreeze protein type I [Paracholeplasma brassicae]|uniref:Antifreeze protein type I n=1 Tax=Acholeplasma brassicae TaxID=61635 RepID=U4KRU9_9MOLU|nr:SPFH domain-containing protein [Paracholeplasma brassicae]CCV66083.1 Antifreeze protein type I [Paracholeplasma brassicae]